MFGLFAGFLLSKPVKLSKKPYRDQIICKKCYGKGWVTNQQEGSGLKVLLVCESCGGDGIIGNYVRGKSEDMD